MMVWTQNAGYFTCIFATDTSEFYFSLEYCIRPDKQAVHITFSKFLPSFENIVNPNQLALSEASWSEYTLIFFHSMNQYRAPDKRG